MRLLKRVRLAGWKSIKEQTIELGPLNVLIGRNGSGKSNLISFFKLLNEMFGRTPGLRAAVGTAEGADALLHFGSRQTPVAEIELTFETHGRDTSYYARWAAAAGGSLIFVDERCEYLKPGYPRPHVVSLGAGHSETGLIGKVEEGDKTAGILLEHLRGCRLFHFHDTSASSAIRKPSYIEADRFLYPDGGNLASMLYLYQQAHPAAYRRILATVQQAVPDLTEFILEPRRLDPHNIVLKWRQRGKEYEFGAHQLSDGSIRFIALAALLLQPASSLPLLIALDEPELGLHPAALGLLAEMAKSASQQCQILLATQSPVLLDAFDPGQVVVVDSRDGASEFRRLSSDNLSDWLEDYTLSEIWEKNVVGGGPYG